MSAPCRPASGLYDSPRLAACYASSRPPVHQHIISAVRRRLQGAPRARRALDIGCGAGLSTLALAPLADTAIGLDAAPAMLAGSRDVAPSCRFVAGLAEHLPFADGSFDLLAAAGSLDYVDIDSFLPEAVRVLAPRGLIVVYDFSPGRRMRGSDRLDAWFASFERRYPFPPTRGFDPAGPDYARFGLRLESCDRLEIALPMTFEAYVEYALSETNVELALSRGSTEQDVRRWCAEGLREIITTSPCDVLFDAYAACVRRA